MKKEKSHKIVFETVWYASEEHAKGHVKLIMYEEIGNLLLMQKSGKLEIQFLQESKVKFTITDIVKVYRASQGFPYFSYIMVITFYMLIGIVSKQLFYIVGIIGLVLPLALLGFFLMRWVVVEAKLDNGTTKLFYFYDGRYKGYAAWFGGNKKILETIKQMIDNDKI